MKTRFYVLWLIGVIFAFGLSGCSVLEGLIGKNDTLQDAEDKKKAKEEAKERYTEQVIANLTKYQVIAYNYNDKVYELPRFSDSAKKDLIMQMIEIENRTQHTYKDKRLIGHVLPAVGACNAYVENDYKIPPDTFKDKADDCIFYLSNYLRDNKEFQAWFKKNNMYKRLTSMEFYDNKSQVTKDVTMRTLEQIRESMGM